ncbi:putative metal-dependent hydrolase [Maribacter sp. PR1]|uniref:Metal-dependent hydrolase n=1 Tax=Maribacter cobaltidurans TaxID=1178778 RepID=A0ABU7IXP0_9FLAO|nr:MULTISPECIES: putative metal-dependent hydrolase [Maribacter]MDC6390350.1 putative metal-dependent hydrolase [Maribacter sp. PR1]MEE1977740.1 putative metal-dependent hydrolase [Maribacter cobaltidurans]
MEDLEKLRYPIGHFHCPKVITKEYRESWIRELEHLPEKLSGLVLKLDEEQLETPYRQDGWTVRQLVHHIADSHHHSYTRFKWALTEEEPLIKAYEEKKWSNLFDSRTAPIEISLDYLLALHTKLVYLLKGLSESDFNKGYMHPDGDTKVTVAENIGKYAWHGNHHFAHIENLAIRKGW